jgi:hypothetical protein
MTGFPSPKGATTSTSIRIPPHVVYRHFVSETVVLNLQTGRYHGLNRIAGRMLEVVDEVGDLERAAARLADEYRQPRSEIRADLEAFCRDLAARRLIEVDHGGA